MKTRKYASPVAAVFAASMLAVASSTAMAAIICDTATVPLAVPQDGTGIYLNLITGANGASPPSGWDFNPYDRGLPGISFWFNNDANRGALWDGTNISVLPSGATVGPASLFTNSVADPGPALWRTTNTGMYMGLRVFNEGTATMNYGWIQLDTGATAGFPATINHFCYQNDGTAITTGTTPVSLQSYSID
ncbi:MAG: hypothetical protein IPF61_00920 [Xanthomonadales bacterium]|nr:hypothetical protein [Xanthomonadales bacterium]